MAGGYKPVSDYSFRHVRPRDAKFISFFTARAQAGPDGTVKYAYIRLDLGNSQLMFPAHRLSYPCLAEHRS